MDQLISRARHPYAADRCGRPHIGTIRRRRLTRLVIVALLVGALPVWTARAGADEQAFALKLVAGKFDPQDIVVPADTPFQLHVTNSGAAAIEFESFELHRERVVQPGETITVYVPALRPGTYPFFDDFHNETAQGSIVSK
jgi:heme/copper-type cytochrome/quinol oxidase subunit 2